MPKFYVMRGRILLGLALGVVGICLGVSGVIFEVELLTIAAAACAVIACFVLAGAALFPILIRETAAGSSGSEATPVNNTKDKTVGSEDTVIDSVTDLPDGRYFEVAVESRVAAARRHLWPVSIVLIQLGFDSPSFRPGTHDKSVAGFAEIMRQTLREADIACRLDETTFGLILEDTSEEGGVWTAERLQIALAQDTTEIRRLVAGVAAYPTHGLASKEVLVRAHSALARASSTPVGHGLGQVEVAHVDLS